MSTRGIVLPAGEVHCVSCKKWFDDPFPGGSLLLLKRGYCHFCDNNVLEIWAIGWPQVPSRHRLWSEVQSEMLAKKEFQERCERISVLLKRKEELQQTLNYARNARVMVGCVSELTMLELLGVECGVTVTWRKHNRSKNYRTPRRAGTVFDVSPFSVTIVYSDGTEVVARYEDIQVLSEKERLEAAKREVEVPS